MPATLDAPPRTAAAPPAGYVSRVEYLLREETAEVKSEWYDGEVREMSGVTWEHSLIATRIAVLLGAAVRGKQFSVHGSELKVRMPDGPYVYPDAILAPAPAAAVLEPPVRPGGPRTVLLNPVAVVEVLSESTEENDRGFKADGYRTIESLTDYLIVSQTDPVVEHHRRTPGGWRETVHTGRRAAVGLRAAGVTLTLADIYEALD